MAFCMNCGTQLSEGAKFCADCGTPVGAVEDKSKNKRRSLCEETVFKCSNCGDIMDAHELVCETCEYERRGAKATTSVKMNERLLIKSVHYNVKKALWIMVIIGAVLTALMIALNLNNWASSFEYASSIYSAHQEDGTCSEWGVKYECDTCESIKNNPTKTDYVLAKTFDSQTSIYFIPLCSFSLIGILVYLYYSSYELFVTDQRIYGKVAWGKKINLPIDSVFSTTTTILSLSGAISISSSSGKINFYGIKNADAIYRVVKVLLTKKHQQQGKPTQKTQKFM